MEEKTVKHVAEQKAKLDPAKLSSAYIKPKYCENKDPFSPCTRCQHYEAFVTGYKRCGLWNGHNRPEKGKNTE